MKTFLIVALLLLVLVEFYSYQAFKNAFQNIWINRAYIVFSLFIFGMILYSFYSFAAKRTGQNNYSLMIMGLFLIIMVPKLIITIVLLTEDVFRIFGGAVSQFSASSDSKFLPERRRFISMAALGIASIPFMGILHGIFIGRYDFRVIKQKIGFPDLPTAFNGFKILQISDIHSGSFDNQEKIEYAIELINQQDYDLLVFTGDLVNTRAVEMDEWIDIFKKIKNPAFGKYSILGNHDYGEYISWGSDSEKEANFEAIKAIHPQIGFNLLLNENIKLQKNGEEIALVGVENWGAKFKKAGDLNKASQGLTKEDFKVLLSHDPSHWDLEVQQHDLNYHLTLSGHTHGMQFGIEIPGFVKWSPVQYVYKRWAGLYEDMGKYIYINRGFGYHAYPGRVGIWPEISLIELEKA